MGPDGLDAKRGDIGSPTAEHYATEAFVRYGADAVTVNVAIRSSRSCAMKAKE
jgi:orotidine-5'-phosphate decarboxylase